MKPQDPSDVLPNFSSDNRPRRMLEPRVSGMGMGALLFLGLAGPALSFGQWEAWDLLRWMLKCFGWLAIFLGCLAAIVDPRLRSGLRFTPWVSSLFTAFMVWMWVISTKPILQIAVPLTWLAMVTLGFTYLRLKVPEFFGLPCPSDHPIASRVGPTRENQAEHQRRQDRAE